MLCKDCKHLRTDIKERRSMDTTSGEIVSPEELAKYAGKIPPHIKMMGIDPTPAQLRRGRIGRNEPCGCGSGKKFKNCCLKRKEEIMTEELRIFLTTYIGAKIIQAVPMDWATFVATVKKEQPNEAQKNELGYKVVYPAMDVADDPYVSWSPKDVFENAYRKITATEAMAVRSE